MGAENLHREARNCPWPGRAFCGWAEGAVYVLAIVGRLPDPIAQRETPTPPGGNRPGWNA